MGWGLSGILLVQLQHLIWRSLKSFHNFLFYVMDEDVDRNQCLGNVSDLVSPCAEVIKCYYLLLFLVFVPWISTQSRNGWFR